MEKIRKNNNLIIVTGFGPFAGHETTNASWEAVRLLPDNIEINDVVHKIQKIQVPVVYKDVDNAVEEIWKLNPKLVVHCGVHGTARCIHLEQYAYNNSFCKPDYEGKMLCDSTASLKYNENTCCEQLSTRLNVDKITKQLNTKQFCDRGMFHCSTDVGNYLCGYMYLKSLDINPDCCLFIHVPPVDQPFTLQETISAVYEVIRLCIKQIDDAVAGDKQKI